MNAEQDVIDAIDALVDETMAAGLDRWGRPRDDYNADRYPKCPQCEHPWHGLACTYCWNCERSEGEAEVGRSPYVDQISAVRYGIDPEAPWLPQHHYNSDQRGAAIIQQCRFDRNGRCVYDHRHQSPPGRRRGYTLSDLRAMQSALHIRLWANTGSRGPQYLAGLIGYYQAHEHADGDVDVVLGIEEAGSSRTIVGDQNPADELPPGQAAIELYQWRTEDFRTVGYVPEDDVTIDHRIDVDATSRGRVIATRESYEIRLRFTRRMMDRNSQILERLLGLGL